MYKYSFEYFDGKSLEMEMENDNEALSEMALMVSDGEYIPFAIYKVYEGKRVSVFKFRMGKQSARA